MARFYSTPGRAGWLCAASVSLAVLAPGGAAAQVAINPIEVTIEADRDLTCGDAGECSLREAIKLANSTDVADQVDEITFGPGVSTLMLDPMLGSLPGISVTAPGGVDVAGLTIRGGGGVTVDGQQAVRIFFVDEGRVDIMDVTVVDGLAEGGDGGNRAGGGLGAGGGLFVDDGATVNLTDVVFLNNDAGGGAGGDDAVGTSAGGGGGGLGGFTDDGTEDGEDGAAGAGGAGGGASGGDGGAPGENGQNGGAFSGGGGAGSTNTDGGSGDFGGGGGGGGSGAGNGGTSVFGGGNGANATVDGMATGTTSGDGGSAFGGAIFVRQGGVLSIVDPSFTGGVLTPGAAGVAAGTPGVAGTAEGLHLYLDEDVLAVLETRSTLALLADVGGAGGIVKRGAEDLFLTGANTYTGPTDVAEGTLRVTGSDFESQTISVADGATLDFNLSETAGDLTVAGAIDIESGAVVQKSESALMPPGPRKLILAGPMTNDGTFIVVSGEVEGNGASFQGDVQLDPTATATRPAVLIFDEPTAGDTNTFVGSISSGPLVGQVVKRGDGRVILDGVNSYENGTVVEAGVLQGDGDSLQGNIRLNGVAPPLLVFDEDGTSTFEVGDRVRGTGSLRKQGSGRLVLEGRFQMNVDVEVAAGELRLSRRADALSNVAGPLRVLGGATLSGDGEADNAVTVESGASIAPGPSTALGTSTATLSADSVTFESGSVFTVEVDPVAPAGMEDQDQFRDQLALTSAATLMTGARVDVNPLPGSLGMGQTRTYTILTAPTITGSFPMLANEDLAFLDATVTTGATAVTLDLTRNNLGFADVARTRNQAAVGAVLDAEDAAGVTGDLAVVIDALEVLTVAEVEAALDQIGGEALSAFTTGQLQNADKSARTVMARLGVVGGRAVGTPGTIELAPGFLSQRFGGGLDRMLADPTAHLGRMLADTSDAGVIQVLPSAPAVGLPPDDQRRFGIWLDGYGIFGEASGNSNSADTDWSAGGALGGFDVRLGSHGLLGLGGGYGRLDVGVDDRSLAGGADIYQGFLYGGYVGERFFVGALGRYAYSDFGTSRRLAFGSIDRKATADWKGHEAGGYVETGYVVAAPAAVQIEPMASFHYTWLQHESFTESGAGSISLDVEEQTWNSLLGTLGLRVHRAFVMDERNETSLVPEVWARYAHQFGDRDRNLDALPVGGITGSSWRVRGAEVSSSGAILGVGWSVRQGRNLAAMFFYDLTWNPDLIAHGIAGGFLVRW